MCDKAVDGYLPELKFVLDWLVANKIIKKLDNIVFSNYDIDLDIDSDIVTFFSNGMYLVTTDFNNITLMMIILMKMILVIF